MKRRPRWSTVVIALGLIAAIAVAVPAFGISKSLKNAIKAEVAKQVANKTGPAGKNGTNGVDGTARAYAMVGTNCTGMGVQTCPFNRAKGVTSVTRASTGEYCVTIPGISSATTPAVTSVNYSSTGPPEGNASAMFSADLQAASCTSTAFSVFTERITGSNPAVPASDVAFVIAVP